MDIINTQNQSEEHSGGSSTVLSSNRLGMKNRQSSLRAFAGKAQRVLVKPTTEDIDHFQEENISPSIHFPVAETTCRDVESRPATTRPNNKRPASSITTPTADPNEQPITIQNNALFTHSIPSPIVRTSDEIPNTITMHTATLENDKSNKQNNTMVAMHHRTTIPHLTLLESTSNDTNMTPLERQELALRAWMNSILVPSTLLTDDYASVGDNTTNLDRLTLNIQNELWRIYACDEDLRQAMLKIEERLANGVLKAVNAEAVLKGTREQVSVRKALACYHPTWLRLAAEIAVGSTSTDTLDVFIRKQVLNDDALLAKHAGCRTSGYWSQLGALVVKRVLLIIGLLDKAILSAHQNAPLLFLPNTGAASSLKILQGAAGPLLGETDVARRLCRLGYKVSYVQSPRQEIDFSVNNLAVDLRDGLKLCKLVEKLAFKDGIFDAAIYPADRRPDRLHNISLAFDALQSAGISLDRVQTGQGIGLLTPSNIVNGDREATVGLVWRLILQYHVPVLVDASQLEMEMDHHVKKQSTRETISVSFSPVSLLSPDLIADAGRGAAHIAALLQWMNSIASLYGACRVSNFGEDLADGRVFCLLAHHYVGAAHLSLDNIFVRPPGVAIKHCRDGCRQNFALVLKAIKILGGIPQFITGDEFHSDSKNNVDERSVVLYAAYLCHRLIQVNKEHRAAMLIQRRWRQRVAHRPGHARAHLHMWIRAATLIQRNVRSWLLRRGLEQFCRNKRQFESGIIQLQSIWRARDYRIEFLEKRGAAIAVQTAWRGYMARQDYFNAVLAPRVANAGLKRYHYIVGTLQQLTEEKAAVKLQSTWRTVVARRKYLATRDVILAKRREEAILSTKKHMEELARAMNDFAVRTRSALRIQSAWRSHLDRTEYARMQELKKERERLQAEKEINARAVIARHIQTHIARQRFLKACRACVRIQRAWRCMQARRDTAAIVIQKHARRHIAISEYILQKHAAIVIQRVYKTCFICLEHPQAVQLRGIRSRLRAAANAVIAAPHLSIGFQTGVAINEVLSAASCNRLPSLDVLKTLARFTRDSAFISCELMVKNGAVNALLTSAIASGRDKTQDISIQWALICIKNVCTCKEYADTIFASILLDGGLRSLLELVSQSRDREELFTATISLVYHLVSDPRHGREMSKYPQLISIIEGVGRLLKHRQSSAVHYLTRLEDQKGSDASVRQATQSLLTVNKQLACLLQVMDAVDGVKEEAKEMIASNLIHVEGKNTIIRSILSSK